MKSLLPRTVLFSYWFSGLWVWLPAHVLMCTLIKGIVDYLCTLIHMARYHQEHHSATLICFFLLIAPPYSMASFAPYRVILIAMVSRGQGGAAARGSQGELTTFFSYFLETHGEEEMWQFFHRWGKVWEIYIPKRRNISGQRFGFGSVYGDIW